MTELKETLNTFDDAFARCDADAVGSFFADDGQLLLHNQPPIVGRAAITNAFRELCAQFDTSAWSPDYDTVEIHSGHAYVLGPFFEVLRPRAGGPGIGVRGRIVLFWQQEADGRWLVTRLLTGRSAPEEEID